MRRWNTLFINNLRFVSSYNIMLSAVIMLLGLLIFEIKGITPSTYVRMCEYLTLFVGPISLIPIADYECGNNIWELVYTRQQSFLPIYIMRILIVCIEDAVILIVPYLVSVMGRAENTERHYYWGKLITVIWFGMIGTFITEALGSKQVAFCILIIYYLFESLTKGKITGDWQLMGYSNNCSVSKMFLLFTTLLLSVFTISLKHLKVRGIYDNRDRSAQ